jgi:hypothetical protein
VKRRPHEQKHPRPSVSTDEGIEIDDNDEQPENADSPIDESWELG